MSADLKQRKLEKLQRMGAYARETIKRDARRVVGGMVLPKGHPDRDPAADLPWTECPSGHRFALNIFNADCALERAKIANGHASETRAIGLVILPSRAPTIEEWDARVKERNSKAIDTTLGPALIEEVKK